MVMKNLSSLLIAAIVLFLLIAGCAKKETDSTAQNAPVSNMPPIEIKAETLTAEYEENEVAADAKYKNKMLAVSGVISNISEVFGSLQIDLEGHKQNGINITTVKCTFAESEKSNIVKLKKNQSVTLIGANEGKTANLYVGLDNCRIK